MCNFTQNRYQKCVEYHIFDTSTIKWDDMFDTKIIAQLKVRMQSKDTT